MPITGGAITSGFQVDVVMTVIDTVKVKKQNQSI